MLPRLLLCFLPDSQPDSSARSRVSIGPICGSPVLAREDRTVSLEVVVVGLAYCAGVVRAVAAEVLTLLAVLALDRVEMDPECCAVLTLMATRKINLLARPACLAAVALAVTECGNVQLQIIVPASVTRCTSFVCGIRL